MSKRWLAWALCVALLVLGGCGQASPAGTPGTRTLTVWRLQEDTESGELTGREICVLPGDGDVELETAVALFAAPSGADGLVCALPAGVTVESWTLADGDVTLSLSEPFLEADAMDRTVAALCAALTLCQVEGVGSVSVAVGEQVLFSRLTEADALTRDTDTDPFVRQLRLYFADGDGRYLAGESHSLTLEEDADADRYVVEELLRGPNDPALQSAIPTGTRLLSCRTEDGVCTVDLSAEFLDGRPQTALGERLALYSLVDSLTELPQVDSVRILAEGEPVERYVYRSLDGPLARYEQAAGPAAAGEIDADLWLPLPGLEGVEPLPWRVSRGQYASEPEAVLAALLVAAEPGYPTLFPGSGTVGGVTVQDGTCTVELAGSFFASIPAEARAVAVRSMTATLCALDGVERVSFTTGGDPALFDGVDWSGPWDGTGPDMG